MTLQIKTYLPQDAIFPIASTLIYGDKEAVLVNAQFQASRAKELVEMVKATGRDLTTIFVSHSDPDYYFALDTLLAAFPEAHVVATAQTAWLIDATKDDKLSVWKDQLGDDAPAVLITPSAIADSIEIEGERIEIRQASDDPAHSFLWAPSLKTALGGVSVFAGTHPWLADTAGLAEVDQWIARLEDIAALKPAHVIPGHSVGVASDSPDSVTFLADYLRTWRAAAETARRSEEIIEPVVAKYPDLQGRDFLDMGAKVFTGELPWKVTQPYPPIGRKVLADFGDFSFELDFKDNHTMTFSDLSGAFGGLSDTVNYTAVPLGHDLFMVYWSEPNSTGANVVHVQDYANGIVRTNIAAKDGSFANLTGKLTLQS